MRHPRHCHLSEDHGTGRGRKGLPVTAIQCRPCKGGFWVRASALCATATVSTAALTMAISRLNVTAVIPMRLSPRHWLRCLL